MPSDIRDIWNSSLPCAQTVCDVSGFYDLCPCDKMNICSTFQSTAATEKRKLHFITRYRGNFPAWSGKETYYTFSDESIQGMHLVTTPLDRFQIHQNWAALTKPSSCWIFIFSQFTEFSKSTVNFHHWISEYLNVAVKLSCPTDTFIRVMTGLDWLRSLTSCQHVMLWLEFSIYNSSLN